MTLEETERGGSGGTYNKLVECPYCGETIISDDGENPGSSLRHHLPCDEVPA